LQLINSWLERLEIDEIETVNKKCSSCNNEPTTMITDPEAGEVICSNCGMVISDKIEQDSRVLFNDEQRKCEYTSG
jgi:transcription initiation factor TFIIIB Brf1 subunit/transcription initiation factor TFIIB